MIRTILNNKRYNLGFTLIELLMVIAVTMLITSVIFGVLNGSKTKARDAVRLSDLEQLRIAVEFYRNDIGYYPSGSYISTGNVGWLDFSNKLVTYMKKLPLDPINVGDPFGGGYAYYYCTEAGNSQPGNYDLVARLETDHNLACENTPTFNNVCDAVLAGAWCDNYVKIYDANL